MRLFESNYAIMAAASIQMQMQSAQPHATCSLQQQYRGKLNVNPPSHLLPLLTTVCQENVNVNALSAYWQSSCICVLQGIVAYE